MSKFQKTVKFLAEFYQMEEREVALTLIDLFKSQTLDWRRL